MTTPRTDPARALADARARIRTAVQLLDRYVSSHPALCTCPPCAAYRALTRAE